MSVENDNAEISTNPSGRRLAEARVKYFFVVMMDEFLFRSEGADEIFCQRRSYKRLTPI